MKASFIFVVGLIFLPAAFGQGMSMSASGGSGPDGTFRGSATFGLPMFSPPARTNAPYSGEQVSESVQTLVDGTHITRPMMGPHEKTWRDSQGRVRTERAMFGGSANIKDVPAIAQINDPVAGFTYILDNVNHVAHRVKIVPPQSAGMARQVNATSATGPSSAVMTGVLGAVVTGGGGAGGGVVGPARMSANGPGAPARPQMSTEDLGTRMIDGVLVYGTRRTTVIPEGSQGNDRPITTTSETWISRELGLTVLSTNYSPISGTTTNKIANLSVSEPDPALFMVPGDYTIVDETDSFTIRWGEK